MKWSDVTKDEEAIEILKGILKGDCNIKHSEYFVDFFSHARVAGFNDEQAAKFVAILISSLGGMQVYLPRGDSMLSVITYRKIYNEFTGDNYRELALKYSMTESSIRRKVKACISADREMRKLIDNFELTR